MSRWLLLTFLVASLAGCALDPVATPPNPVLSRFRVEVYPVLLRDCGFPACHGNEDRFFRVYGPGRTRPEDVPPVELPAPDIADCAGAVDIEECTEIYLTRQRALSMLSGVDRPEDALLLRKPLEVDQGGAPHLGIDDSGRDVYASPEDGGYAIILGWSDTGF